MSASGYEMAKAVLKPPVRLTAVTFDETRPAAPQYKEEFNSLEEAYAFFRKEKPSGRWIVWLRGASGQGLGLDSQLWEKGMDKPVKD
jgi:hypothetical protein